MGYQPGSPYQPRPEEGERRQYLLDGVRDIEYALYIQIAAFIILTIGTIALALKVASLRGGGFNPNDLAEVMAELGTIMAGIAFLLIFAAIVTIVAFIKMYRGFSKLAVADSQYSIGRTGLKLEIAGVGLAILGGLAAIPGILSQNAGAVVGALMLVSLGVLLLIVGGIMVLIAFWRLGSLEDGSYIHIGLILNLIGGLVSANGGGILMLIGTILIYLGVKNIREKLEATEYSPQPPTMGTQSF